MTEAASQERRVAFVDADNTLWDTDGVFASAQLNLLRGVELETGRLVSGADRLDFVRAVDQALAEKHHLGLRYPPTLLAAGLAYALGGDQPRVAARKAWTEGSSPGEFDVKFTTKLGSEFARQIERMPDLLPGVRDGLQRLHAAGVTILVVTEGAGRRVKKTAEALEIARLFDRIIEAPKSERLFRRVQKLGRVRLPAYMIGDQLRRDIEPAKAAGLITIYIPSRFRPQWEPEVSAVGPAYRVDRFDLAADLVLAAK